jgi:lipopolysaccharide transport system ATP-binding protein
MAVEAVALKTSGLGKRYTLGVGGADYGSLRDTLADAARMPLRRLKQGREKQSEDEARVDTIWALRDISITVRHGEVVGLIGHNGAGKSTLLKILSRITEPTVGRAEVTGRVGTLLEVGTGFHPELTGRENIFLNGAILGMRRTEIRRRFDEIVAFADVGRFLETPVKRYSSGMQVRLAFAVAAHLEPEILLVDEVLAVGDASFQRRSLAKMTEVAKEGRTVIFVSHNLGIIRATCERGILLDKGATAADGPIGKVIDMYLGSLERAASDDLLSREDRDRRGWRRTLIRKVAITDLSSGQSDVVVGGRPARITIDFTELLPTMECSLTIVNNLGQPITTLDSEVSGPDDVRDGELGPCIECDVSALPLLPGRYRIDVVLKGHQQFQDGLEGAAFFDVEPGVMVKRPMPAEGADGDVVVPHSWRLPAKGSGGKA